MVVQDQTLIYSWSRVWDMLNEVEEHWQHNFSGAPSAYLVYLSVYPSLHEINIELAYNLKRQVEFNLTYEHEHYDELR